MRNSGWYIPFWRKPKRVQGESQPAERTEKERKRRPRPRSDEELERVRAEWVTRYTRQLQAFRLLGLSVGAPQAEISLRYHELVRAVGASPDAGARLHALHEAFETLRLPE